MDRAFLDKWIEQGIVFLVLAALVVAPLLTGAVRGQDFALVQGLLLLALALWLVRFWINRSHRLLWPPAAWLVIVFTGYVLGRYVQSDVEYVARQEFIRVLTYAWLFFIVLNNLHSQEASQRLLLTLLVLGSLLAAYAIFQVLTGSNRVWTFIQPPGYAGRGSGTFICPNHLAGYLELLLPVALAGVLLSRVNVVVRVILAYVALLLLIGIGFTMSRGGYLATAAALIGMFALLFRYRGYRKVILVAVGVLVLAGGAFLYKSDRAKERFTKMFVPAQAESAFVRSDIWKPAAKMWLDHPWLGVGPAHFDIRTPQYRTPALQSRPVWVHNDYLNTLTDYGLVGALIIGGFMGLAAWGVKRTWRYVHRADNALAVKRSDRAAHVLGVATGVVALLVHSVTDFHLHVPAVALTTVALLASLTGHLRFATAKCWISPRLTGRVLVAILGLASLGYLGPQAIRGFREGRALTLSETAATVGAQLQALQTAWVVEPANWETAQRIGEYCRLTSWEGPENWRQIAEDSIGWFQRAGELNRWESAPRIRRGMSLDWLERHEEATPFFEEAVRLDSNSYYTWLMRGWHELQRGNYAEAKQHFERSLQLKSWENFLAFNYLKVVQDRLQTTTP